MTQQFHSIPSWKVAVAAHRLTPIQHKLDEIYYGFSLGPVSLEIQTGFCFKLLVDIRFLTST